ncbi:MAG: NRDE family protein [Chitinophagaceae bacterium]|nr:NRDE family protein [Chitinophagaceae bacterium]
MCTVTYLPSKEHLVITSNRDEKNWRTDAIAPSLYKSPSGKLMYPKDGDAGGTWIAAHENGNVVVFLNGAFVAHTPSPPYRKSRGLILLDLIHEYSPFRSFQSTSLQNIEPFTAMIRDNSQLYECRWDGKQKHIDEKDAAAPHIWSSATLYDKQTIAKRKKWFDDWLEENSDPSQENILHFHQFTGDGDSYNDLRMNRGKVFTVSITSIEINSSGLNMDYLDLKNEKRYAAQLLFDSSIAGK